MCCHLFWYSRYMYNFILRQLIAWWVCALPYFCFSVCEIPSMCQHNQYLVSFNTYIVRLTFLASHQHMITSYSKCLHDSYLFACVHVYKSRVLSSRMCTPPLMMCPSREMSMWHPTLAGSDQRVETASEATPSFHRRTNLTVSCESSTNRIRIKTRTPQTGQKRWPSTWNECLTLVGDAWYIHVMTYYEGVMLAKERIETTLELFHW